MSSGEHESEGSKGRQGAARGRRTAVVPAPIRRSSRANSRNAGQRVRGTGVSEYEEINARVSEAQAEAVSEAARVQDQSPQRDADAGDVDRIPLSEDVDGRQQLDEDNVDPMEVDSSSSEDDVVEVNARNSRVRTVQENDDDDDDEEEMEQKYEEPQNNSRKKSLKKKKIQKISSRTSKKARLQNSSSSSDIRTISEAELNRIIRDAVAHSVTNQLNQNARLVRQSPTQPPLPTVPVPTSSVVKTHLPPQFTGESDSTIRPEPWMADVDAHFTGLAEPTKIIKFATFLTGQASVWYYNLRKTNNPTIQTWSGLMSAFIKQFNAPIPPAVAFQLLSERKQSETETVAEYMAAFNGICAHLSADYNETVRVGKFIMNLRQPIRVAMGSQFFQTQSQQTLAQTYVSAVAAENLIKGYKHYHITDQTKKSDHTLSNTNNTRKDVNNQDSKQNDHSRKQWSKRYSRNYQGDREYNNNRRNNFDKSKSKRDHKRSTQSNDDKSRIECYACHQYGHYANECPNRNDSSSTTSSTKQDSSASTKSSSQKARSLDERDRSASTKGSHGHNMMIPALESDTSQSVSPSVPSSMSETVQSYLIKGDIAGITLSVLVDTGASLSVISSDTYMRMSLSKPKLVTDGVKPIITGINGSRINILGHIDTHFVPNVANQCSLPIRLYVVAEQNPLYECVLGMDFITAYIGQIITNPPSFRFNGHTDVHKFEVRQTNASPKRRYQVFAERMIKLNPHSEVTIRGKIHDSKDLSHNPSMLFAGIPIQMNAHSITAQSSLCTPDKSMCIPVTLVNTANKRLKINTGTVLGYLEHIESVHAHSLQSVSAQVSPTELSNRSDCISQFEEAFKDLDLHGSVVETDPDAFIKLKQLLVKYHDVFAKNNSAPGRTDLVEHSIDTGNAQPIKSMMYRQPLSTQQVIQQHVEVMLNDRIIVPSDSPWSSNVIIVRKKDGTDRVVIDYRKLNTITRKDAYPIPRIDEILDSTGKAIFFTSLDCASGYWSIKMAKEDASKTAFSTRSGHYEFTVMPFGLTNAPATFQRLMNKILAGILYKYAMVYIDDIVIFSSTLDDHFRHLEDVFTRLRTAGLTLKTKKCKFLRQQISFLGHVVSGEGIQPDREKIKVIMEWPRPTNVKEVQSFLGMVNYYRRFIKNLATIATPLYQLTRKGKVYHWSDACQTSFETLRRALVNEPVLRSPDLAKPFILHTDASGTGIGAVLSQLDERDGRDHAIAYISRTLSSAERNYSVTQLECLGVVWAVRTFRPYILGQQFKIVTDHSALRWLFAQPNPCGRLARWIETMLEYNYTVEYRSGTANGNADALSRLHALIAVGSVNETDMNDTDNSIKDDNVSLTSHWYSKISSQQALDTYCKSIINYLQSVHSSIIVYPSSLTTQTERNRFIAEADEYFIANGILYHVDARTGKRGIYIPKPLRVDVLNVMHNDSIAGHLGVKRTLERMSTRFYWRGMPTDVHRHIEQCTECLQNKVSRHPGQVPAGNLPIPTQPFEIVGVDFLGPLPKTTARNIHILVITDYLTRWAEAIALPNQQARTYASAIMEHVILRHGAPRVLLSDNAKDFNSKLAFELYELCKIKKLVSTSYHPQTNGLTERFNHTLVTMLSNYVNERQTDWDVYLPYVMFAYRTAQQETVKHSPFYLLYGREPRLPIDAMIPTSTEPLFISPTAYTEEVQRRLQVAHKAVQRLLLHVEEKRAEDNKELDEDKIKRFHIGEVVMKRVHQVTGGKSLKLAPKWAGKYQVIDVLANGRSYQIHPIDTHKRLKSRSQSEFVHVSQLKSVPYALTHVDTNKNGTDGQLVKSLLTPSSTNTTSSASITDENNTAATHPDYREKLPTRMAKHVQQHTSESLRRSDRSNKGQRQHDKSFVDSRYVEFDNDIDLLNTKKSHEFDE